MTDYTGSKVLWPTLNMNLWYPKEFNKVKNFSSKLDPYGYDVILKFMRCFLKVWDE